jgi:hypothetical protein
MSKSSDALDHRPGKRPDKRMVGSDLVLVFPVIGLARAHAHIHLNLRIDADGELFAAIGPRPQDAG